MSATQADITLKPCPFCGGTDIYLGRGGVNCPVPDPCGTWGYLAGCKNTSCHSIVLGPGLPDGFHRTPGLIESTREQALLDTAAKWNRRRNWWNSLPNYSLWRVPK